MKLNKIVLPTILLAGALAVGTIGVLPARADELSNYPVIVTKIAEKFNLNKDDVMGVFDEVQADREATRLQDFETRLDDAVGAGTITEDQKNAILSKHEEIQSEMESLRSQNLSRDEMRQKMQEVHDSLRSWATSQGIDMSLLGPREGNGFGRHTMGGRMWLGSGN